MATHTRPPLEEDSNSIRRENSCGSNPESIKSQAPSFATVARLAAAFRVPAAKVADVRRAKEEQKVAAQGGSSRDLLGASVSTTTTSRRSSSERLSFVKVESERKSSLVPMSKEQMNFKIGMCLDHMPG